MSILLKCVKGEFLFHSDEEERRYRFLGHMYPGPGGRREVGNGGQRNGARRMVEKTLGWGEKDRRASHSDWEEEGK